MRFQKIILHKKNRSGSRKSDESERFFAFCVSLFCVLLGRLQSQAHIPADSEYLFPFWVDTRMISPFWSNFVFHKPLFFPQLLGFSEQPIFTKSRYGHCCPYRLLLLLVQTVNAYSASSPSASSSSRARIEMLIRLLSMSMSMIFTFTTSPIATISFTFSTRLSAS